MRESCDIISQCLIILQHLQKFNSFEKYMDPDLKIAASARNDMKFSMSL
jgi:hypothetical protein